MATLKAMEVDNIDFLIERMGQDCAPNQYLRELTQNAIEAVQRTGRADGHIVWDHFLTEDGVRKLCIVDNGDGMTGLEMIQYINKLSSSRSEQGMTGNYGVGAKIAAAVHSPRGLVYMSTPDHDDDGGTYSVQLMKAEGKYGLVPFGDDAGYFEYYATVEDEQVPEHLKNYDSGTMVVILGKTDDADTAAGPVDQWVRKSLNTRYFTVPKNIRIQCRDARRTADGDDVDFDDEMKANGLRSVHGQKWMLDGVGLHRGVVELATARAHWWIVPTDSTKFEPPLRLPNAPKPITSMHTFHPAFNYKGHAALVYQNELYDVRTQLHGYHRLQTFGVILGMSQVVIYLEPTKGSITTDTARTRLLINGQEPPWNEWAEEFKATMPSALAEFIESFDVGKNERNDNAAIREKVKELLPLFNLPRYRKTDSGKVSADEASETGAPPSTSGGPDGEPATPGPGGEPKPRPLLGRLKPGGPKASLVSPKDIPDVVFLYGEKAAEIMNEDIAAHYVHAGLVQANGNFRVFRFLVDHFAQQYGDAPGVRKKIVPIVEKWVKIVVCDVVLGLRAMGSAVWTQSKIDENLRNDEALTMALVPRILLSQLLKREVYRDVGKPADETDNPELAH
jgi:hypothetical protein